MNCTPSSLTWIETLLYSPGRPSATLVILTYLEELTQYQNVVSSFLDATLQPGILFDLFVDLHMNGGAIGVLFE